MAFKVYTATGITTQTIVHTGPASTDTTVIGFSVCNTSGNAITIDVLINSAYMCKTIDVPAGATFVPVGGEQKLVIGTGDTISVVGSDTVDIIISVLEQAA